MIVKQEVSGHKNFNIYFIWNFRLIGALPLPWRPIVQNSPHFGIGGKHPCMKLGVCFTPLSSTTVSFDRSFQINWIKMEKLKRSKPSIPLLLFNNGLHGNLGMQLVFLCLASNMLTWACNSPHSTKEILESKLFGIQSHFYSFTNYGTSFHHITRFRKFDRPR